MQIQFCMCMEFIVSNPANQSKKYVVVFGVCALSHTAPSFTHNHRHAK